MVVGVVLVMFGCVGRYTLDRRPVKQISEAERKSRSRAAYERARERVRDVREGMSPAEVQGSLGAVIVVEEGEAGEGGQRKLMDGFVCRVNPGVLRERWLFGYDEGNVLLVGFAVEFMREDAKDDDWTVKRVDRSPTDDCPVVGDTYLD
ncbi:MAG: hypothetical protein IT293_08900 [Deltaproteobacteria bacterium]|nr:hypothetical protein [Deltaproteobacteria bacterium]